MAELKDVQDSIAAAKAAQDAESARVEAKVAALSQQITDLQTQIAGGTLVTAADLDNLKAGVDAITAEANAEQA